MTSRKSIKKIVQDFQSDADDVKLFATAARVALSAPVDYLVVRVRDNSPLRDFEDLILNALKGAINNAPVLYRQP